MLKTTDEILKNVNLALENLSYDRRPASLYAPVQYVLFFCIFAPR